MLLESEVIKQRLRNSIEIRTNLAKTATTGEQQARGTAVILALRGVLTGIEEMEKEEIAWQK